MKNDRQKKKKSIGDYRCPADQCTAAIPTHIHTPGRGGFEEKKLLSAVIGPWCRTIATQTMRAPGTIHRSALSLLLLLLLLLLLFCGDAFLILYLARIGEPANLINIIAEPPAQWDPYREINRRRRPPRRYDEEGGRGTIVGPTNFWFRPGIIQLVLLAASLTERINYLVWNSRWRMVILLGVFHEGWISY